MKLRKLTILTLTILLLGCGQAENAKEDVTQASDVQTTNDEQTTATDNTPVLTFEANTIEGEAVTSDIFTDSKLTMLNVWATYCSPCLNEMPDLGEIANSYDKEEFQMYGIISDVQDGDTEMMETANQLIAETKADYPHLVLSESLYTNLLSGVTSVPTTFFVNRDGEVLGYLVGAQSKEAWESIINELLEDVK